MTTASRCFICGETAEEPVILDYKDGRQVTCCGKHHGVEDLAVQNAAAAAERE
jgi:hypothetical protein